MRAAMELGQTTKKGAARVEHLRGMAQERLQFSSTTDAFVRPGLEEILQGGNFLGREAGNKGEGIQLDAQEGENNTGAFDFLNGQRYPQTGGKGSDGVRGPLS